MIFTTRTLALATIVAVLSTTLASPMDSDAAVKRYSDLEVRRKHHGTRNLRGGDSKREVMKRGKGGPPRMQGGGGKPGGRGGKFTRPWPVTQPQTGSQPATKPGSSGSPPSGDTSSSSSGSASSGSDPSTGGG